MPPRPRPPLPRSPPRPPLPLMPCARCFASVSLTSSTSCKNQDAHWSALCRRAERLGSQAHLFRDANVLDLQRVLKVSLGAPCRKLRQLPRRERELPGRDAAQSKSTYVVAANVALGKLPKAYAVLHAFCHQCLPSLSRAKQSVRSMRDARLMFGRPRAGSGS